MAVPIRMRLVGYLVALGLLAVILVQVPAGSAQAQAGSGVWSQLGADLLGEDSGDRFGGAVDVSADGQTVVVGANGNTGTGPGAGHARVFRLSNGLWQQLGADIDGREAESRFGTSVAISDDGNTVVVGASNFFSLITYTRVYRFAGGGWSQVGSDIPGGSSVDVSGDGETIAVAEWSVSSDDTTVTVYDLVGGDWSMVVQPLEAPVGDQVGVGFAVALSGDATKVAMSSQTRSVNSVEFPGRVRVFRRGFQSITGMPIWERHGDDIDMDGNSLAIADDGNTVVVGDLSANEARAFRFVSGGAMAPGSWDQLGGTIEGEVVDDGTGSSVSMSGDGAVLAVGSHFRDARAGRVRLLEMENSTWLQLASPLAGDEADDFFGGAVALSSDSSRLVVGATGNDSGGDDAGLVRVFGAPGLVEAVDDEVLVVAPDEPLVDVLGNDAVNRLGVTSLEVTVQPSQAAAVVEGLDVRYVPGVSTSTTDSFTYQVCTDTECDSATVTVLITPPTCGRWGPPLEATIWGTDGPDTITVGSGDDVIVTFGGDDVVNAGDGDNTICTGDGDDTVTSGEGQDFVRAGEGADTLNTGRATDRLFGDEGDDILSGEGGTDVIYGGVGNDTIWAGSGADYSFGGVGDDIMNGQGGQDRMFGEAGNDTMQGNFQSDLMRGGPGDDIIRGAAGRDRLYGDEGDDEMYGGTNTDLLEGGPGNDKAFGQAGRDKPYVPDVKGCNAELTDSC